MHREHPPVPPFLDQLPLADATPDGVTIRTVENEAWTVRFMHAPRTVTIPAHQHGAQWGVVLEGSMILTVNGKQTTLHRGATHYVPPGDTHEATLFAGWHGLYVFARRHGTSENLI